MAPTPWGSLFRVEEQIVAGEFSDSEERKPQRRAAGVGECGADGEGARRRAGHGHGIEARVKSRIQRDEVVNDREELKRSDVASGRAVPVAIHDARLAALIGEERVAVSIGTYRPACINGRAAGDKRVV